jgi:hypothetical protein
MMHKFVGVGTLVFAIGLLAGFVLGDNRPRYWPHTGNITVKVDPSPDRRGALVNIALDGHPLCWIDLDEGATWKLKASLESAINY